MKDVDFISTGMPLVDRMLVMAGVGPDDHLVDLGSGDGRIVIAAARCGARATGVECDLELIKQADRAAAKDDYVDILCNFVHGDFLEYDFSYATVVTAFLNPQLMRRLLPKFLALRPGTRVVSNTFPMWTADLVDYAETGDMFHTALLYRV